MDEWHDNDIAARHRKELLWSEEDARLAELAMRREGRVFDPQYPKRLPRSQTDKEWEIDDRD